MYVDKNLMYECVCIYVCIQYIWIKCVLLPLYKRNLDRIGNEILKYDLYEI